MIDYLPSRWSWLSLASIGLLLALPKCGGEVAGSDGVNTGGAPGNATLTSTATATYMGIALPTGGGSFSSGAAGNGGGYSAAGALAVTGGFSTVGGASSTLIDCRNADCENLFCIAGYTLVTLAGDCCPSCIEDAQACQLVVCSTPNCPAGYAQVREPGACCDTCGATVTATPPYCDTVDCGIPTSCSLGYVVTNTAWTCCPTCAPDPNYCETDADCIIASKESCCSCPTSISTRRYAEDPCYSAVDNPRSVPVSCAPQGICDIPCYACTDGDLDACLSNTCGISHLLN